MSLTQLGRYKITGTLGRGAMGVVYKAYDPLIERTVAIKTVDHTSLSREEAEDFERRFKREAKSAGRLNHPNIVTIHDVGRSDDLSYIAMEFLVGQSLREIMDSGHELSLVRIAEIAAQIADGLAFAHSNDVVHRDIKPANIMVLNHDVVKITDFGVALLPAGGHSLDGTTCGSPKYMAPEQITGKTPDGRSDIFSLGTVLYEMLAGRPAFTGDDLSSILYQVLNEAPPLPSTYYPSLPHGFDRIVARAMAKSPEKRYQNAAEMSADLRKYRRYAKLEKKRQRTGDDAHGSDKPVSPGEAESGEPFHVAPDLRRRALRYGVPGVLGVLLAGALLWWNLTPSTVDVKSDTVVNAAQNAPQNATTVEEVPLALPAAEAPSQPPVPETPVAINEPPSVAQVVAPDAASEPAKSETSEATETPAVAPAVPNEGRVRLAIAPWGEVYVDNRKVGISPPLTEIKLKPGKHTIEIRNGDFAPYQQSINLTANASLRIKHKFE